MRNISHIRLHAPMDHAFDLSGFETWLRSWGASDTTIADRLFIVGSMIRVVGDPATATEQDLTDWLSNPNWSPWTRVTYHSHLRSLFEWVRKSGLRADDPTIDIRRPKTPSSLPRPLAAVEVDRVLATATGDLATWLKLGMYAGLRAFEVAKFRGEDISKDGIYVVGKGGKVAMLPTHAELWRLAQEYPRHGYWFPGRGAVDHVHNKTITIRTTTLFESLGIVGSHHRARHTYGTNLLRNGVNIRIVQELMRHASLSSTQKYTLVEDDEKRLAIMGLAA